jgi:hypothetical protein
MSLKSCCYAVLAHVVHEFDMVHTDINLCTMYSMDRSTGALPEDPLDAQLRIGCLGDWVNAEWDIEKHSGVLPSLPRSYKRLMDLSAHVHAESPSTVSPSDPDALSDPTASRLPSVAGPSKSAASDLHNTVTFEEEELEPEGGAEAPPKKVQPKTSQLVFAALQTISPYDHKKLPHHDLESVFLAMLVSVSYYPRMRLTT